MSDSGSEIPPPRPPVVPDPAPEPSGWRPEPRRGAALLWMLAALVAAVLIIPFTPAGRKLYRRVTGIPDRLKGTPEVRTENRAKVEERVVEKRVEVPVERTVPPPPPLPTGPVLSPRTDLRNLFNGLSLKSTFKPEPGRNAAQERLDPGSYGIEFTVRVKVPQPAKTLAELKALNAALPGILPGLPEMMQTAKVSGFYHYLYGLKQKAVQDSILRLDRVLSRHNFYDLETILELEHPTGKGKVLLMQAEMDVVSDGSDGDRMADFDDYIFKSQHFQPTTSYGWAKVTTRVNPLVPRLQKELAEAREKLKSSGLGKDEKSAFESKVASLPSQIAELGRRSYLIGQEDPFIVIPLSLRQYKGQAPWAPAIGDYAVVMAGGKIMPAIVGDFGPTTKVGEASLRIARELNPKASPYNRPINDLTVTYLIFPNSADPARQPDYSVWRNKCRELLEGIGGLASGHDLMTWKDRLKPEPPVPAPVPVPDSAAGGAASEGKTGSGGVPVESKAGQDDPSDPPKPASDADKGASSTGGTTPRKADPP